MDELLREASKLCLDLWNAGGPKLGGEQYPNMANVIDLHQRIERYFAEGERSERLIALPEANVSERTDRILEALFGGGTVHGRMVIRMPPQQIPNPKKRGIGVDEEDYRDGGL